MPEPVINQIPPIVDPSGTKFEILLNDEDAPGRPLLVLHISGRRITGEPTRVRLNEFLYQSEIFAFTRSIEDFLTGNLLTEYQEFEGDYFVPTVGSTPCALSRYSSQGVGFDVEAQSFYYTFSNTRSTHKLLLEDPQSTLERFAGMLDSLS